MIDLQFATFSPLFNAILFLETHEVRLAAKEGMGVLVISDDLDELLELSDRIVIMTAGRMSGSHCKTDLTRASLLAAMSKV